MKKRQHTLAVRRRERRGVSSTAHEHVKFDVIRFAELLTIEIKERQHTLKGRRRERMGISNSAHKHVTFDVIRFAELLTID